MRIAHVITANHRRGGMEVFLCRLAVAMQQAGVQQTIYCQPSHGDADDLAAYLQSHGITVVTNSLHRKNWLGRWQLKNALKKFQPNVVLSWLPRAAQLVPKGRWKHVAQVGWYRGLDCYERAEYMALPTPDMQKHFAELGFLAERIQVLPHFADLAVGKPLDRASLDTPNNVPVFLALGRLEPIKGFDIALQALTNVPDAYLWLAGEGVEEEKLKAQAHKLGIENRVRFLGWRKDVADLMTTADALIMPSRLEPLGLIMLEAWQQGTPVIAAHSAGPNYLIEDGVSGLLCAAEDPDALAMQMNLFIQEPALRQQLSAGGQAALNARFTAEITVQAYLDYFRTVIPAYAGI